MEQNLLKHLMLKKLATTCSKLWVCKDFRNEYVKIWLVKSCFFEQTLKSQSKTVKAEKWNDIVI